MTSQALASLTAQYTDSEGEEDMEDGQTSDKSPGSTPQSYSVPTTPLKPSPTNTSPKVKRLVSYNDDTIVSDEDTPNVEREKRISMEIDDDEPIRKPAIVSEDGVTIPPEPPGKCSAELQEKISHLYQKMIHDGKDMNKVIQDRKSFRNPSIYEKLIQFCNINELDTNYPPEIYDPLRWGKESYYEELAKSQKTEMDRREKDRKEKLSKIDFTTGLVKKSDVDDDPKKRKSKWDQAAPNSLAGKQTVKPAGLVQPALTTSATGTKGTVISAFGSLPKKSKI